MANTFSFFFADNPEFTRPWHPAKRGPVDQSHCMVDGGASFLACPGYTAGPNAIDNFDPCIAGSFD
jgi:hypothetical protein